MHGSQPLPGSVGEKRNVGINNALRASKTVASRHSLLRVRVRVEGCSRECNAAAVNRQFYSYVCSEATGPRAYCCEVQSNVL